MIRRAFPAEEGRAWAASPAARANRPGLGALGGAEARRPGGRRLRQAALRRPSSIGAGTQVARRGCDTRSSARALAHKGARFLAPRPLCQSRVASINAKSPPPFAGKRALWIYDSQAFSARHFSSGSISMLSSGMGSDFMRLRPRNSLAAMAAKISAKPLIILTVIASL